MIIQPKIRGFICTTAHPEGCFQEVAAQVNFVKSQSHLVGPKRALIIGCSTGYGLASRVAATFGSGASTIGVCYERAGDEKRTATAGWYNTAAFEQIAQSEGYYAKTINGDAFSDEIKQQAIALIKKDLGKIDLIVYSLASPRRLHPDTKKVYSSVLKPIGEDFTSRTVDPFRREVKEITLQPASDEEIEHTVQVMGGEDWERWIDLLHQENLLTENVKTVAYSYIGPHLTHAIYKNGTIGRAKEHLHATANRLNKKLASLQGRAFISVNKALVTQASAAIPVVPLYISLLYKLMKQKGTHEGCIQQIVRLFWDFLYAPTTYVDEQGLIRLDDFEMQPDIQAKIDALWLEITSDNLEELTDIAGYTEDFQKLFGFNQPNIDYQIESDPRVSIPSIKEELMPTG